MHKVSSLKIYLAVALLFIATLLGLGQSIMAQDSSVVVICPEGQGYWANHPESWTVLTLTLGDETYTQAELLAIIPGGGGDASTILAAQLIAVKLNIAAGADGTAISSAVAQADSVLAAFDGRLPYNIASSSAEGQTMVGLAGIIESYNSGVLITACLSLTLTPESTSESTAEATAESTANPDVTVIIIIEGPVQAININIITIYDIDIQLAPNDPLLAVIQIGDLVRVEGNVSPGSTTNIVIIAVTVVIVNIEVYIVDGEVWRDPGDCSNGPPDWAPAHGWRRRCEGNNNNGGNGNGNGNGGGMGMGDDDD
jgi:hypothetical protein